MKRSGIQDDREALKPAFHPASGGLHAWLLGVSRPLSNNPNLQ